MRYMAVDYGLKRIGLALCDGGEIIVSPLCQIENVTSNRQLAFDSILTLIREHAIEALVVGLPVNMDGTMG
ncbi:MAG: Holliday junction resolvase RuvX, partial [Sedimentisphaerales bacterium]|nr:Holliday junction resolvase RuvX [Sedimentisphaerales bacterium]